jgi:cytochrome oxidase assembly protein ShyY1
MIALHVLVIVLVVVMATLSAWQFRRLDDRRAFNEQVRSRASMPAAAIADIVGLSPEEAEWRPVVVRGTFRPDDEVIVLNRSQNNTAGVDALTPLDFSIDGKKFVVLVDRGFVPLSVAVPPPAQGEVEFLARARKSQDRRLGGLTDPAEGELREVQRVDVARLADQMKSTDDQTVLPFYVDYLQSTSGADDIVGLSTVANPELSEGSHLSYAIQWIIFSLCAVGAWVILVRRAIQSRPSA